MSEMKRAIKAAKRVYLSCYGETARIAKKRALNLVEYGYEYNRMGESLFIKVCSKTPQQDTAPQNEPQPEAPAPDRTANRNPVASNIGDVKWVPVNDLIQVWLKSSFGKMKPPSKNWGTQSLMSLDREYAALTQDQAQRILDETRVDDVVWQAEKTDCDNIARYMASRVAILYGLNSVAVVDAIDEGHSYCAFLLHDEAGKVYLRGFEPQTDQWRDDVEPKQGWIHFG